ncbi:MAG TPA: hypothetical protein VEQ10_20695 [Vicinamibacteria bacterium]|nr:hypothetical protein [Vicinamibacteria bacterium]
MNRVRALGLLAGVAALGLLPLYGDPGPAAAVSHPEWARMLLRGLDLLVDTAGVNDTAQQVFLTLSGRDSRALGAEQQVRGTHVEVVEEQGVKRIRPVGGIGEAVFALAVARPGEYRPRFYLAGPAAAAAELTRAGQDKVLRRLSLPATTAMSWVDAGPVPLDAGAYEATVLLPPGAALEYVEIAPPCVHPIEPGGGWKPTAVTTTEDVAVTMLQALDLETELPPAGEALRFAGRDLVLDDGSRAVQVAQGDGSFRSGAHGARVLLIADVPEDGLYTLSALGAPVGGHHWVVDGCRTCVVCPSTDPTPRWRAILSAQLHKGRHLFAASLGADTTIQALSLEPKKHSPADYVATLARLGLDVGPSGPVSREKAEEARRFLGRQRLAMRQELCPEILERGTLVAETVPSGPASASGGGVVPPVPGGNGGGGGGAGGGGGPVPPPPVVPPLPPGSPVLPAGMSN